MKREETAATVDIPRSPSSSNFLEGDKQRSERRYVISRGRND